MPLLRLVAYVWASPNTVLGLVLGLLSFQRPRVVEGTLAFDGSRRGVLWLISAFGRTAITFGHVVLSNRALSGRLLAHELHHVRQYERLGPLYIPLYLVIYVFTGYRRHPFEEAARIAELGVALPDAARE
jgi:hypothetical protein